MCYGDKSILGTVNRKTLHESLVIVQTSRMMRTVCAHRVLSQPSALRNQTARIMTLNSRVTGVLQASGALISNRTVLVGAAVLCVCGMAASSVLIANGTISLDRLRQSVAAVGTKAAEEIQTQIPVETAQPSIDSQIVQPLDQAEAAKTLPPPTFDIVRVEPDGNAVLAGLAHPGDQIEVMSGKQVLARAHANSAGEWALVLDEALPVGGHQIAVRSTSNDTGEPRISVQNVTVAVPEDEVESAIVMLDQPGKPSTIWQSPATIIRPDTSEQPVSLPELTFQEQASPSLSTGKVKEDVNVPSTDMPEAATEPGRSVVGDTEPLVTIETVETEGVEDLMVSGASRPNASIRLFLDNRLIGETVAGPVGRWHLQTTHLVPQGRLMLRAEQVEYKNGAVLARREVPFERDPEIVGSLAATFDPGNVINDKIRVDTAIGQDNVKVAGKMVRSQRVVVGKGDNLWTIARRIYGSGVRYTTLYSANEQQIRNPATVFPDQVLVLPVEESLAN